MSWDLKFPGTLRNQKALLYDLKSKIDERAFEYIRVQMGIIDMEDIDLLVDLPKSEIEYNKFDKL